ncbi:MAG TPA: hypothetical protein VGO70_08650 [Arsenicitalea sp.]|nr:hypothetical protein [Arsenicitalea sp.]
MNKFQAITFATGVAILLMSGGAFAQVRVAPPPVGIIPGNPGGDSGCQVLCDSDGPGDPGDPGNPGNPGNPDNPDKPGMTKAEAAFQVCGDRLAELRKVTPNRIKAIGADDSVKIIPVCESSSIAGSDAEQAFIGRGNATGLVGVIGANTMLVGALEQSRHAADDVVGVIVDHSNVTLYVHKR